VVTAVRPVGWEKLRVKWRLHQQLYCVSSAHGSSLHRRNINEYPEKDSMLSGSHEYSYTWKYDTTADIMHRHVTVITYVHVSLGYGGLPTMPCSTWVQYFRFGILAKVRSQLRLLIKPYTSLVFFHRGISGRQCLININKQWSNNFQKRLQPRTQLQPVSTCRV